jgi:1-phosphatidylinositol phosphodiesterase
VQDFCEVLESSTIPQKLVYTTAHLDAAAKVVNPIPGLNTDKENPVPPGPLYLNFLSASNFWRQGCWPDRIAARLNPEVLAYLCERHGVSEEEGKGDGGTGVVVADWVGVGGDWDLVRCVVGMNGRLVGRGGERQVEVERER